MSKVRPALDTLREIRDGKFLDELDVALNELVRQVRATDKGGELTIKINVSPMDKGDATRVVVRDAISVKAPRHSRATLFYTTHDANLQKRDPNQPDLPFLRDADEDVKDHTTTNAEEAK